jgi:hypothetical protein
MTGLHLTILELLYDIDHDKISQVISVFDLISAATREHYVVFIG